MSTTVYTNSATHRIDIEVINSKSGEYFDPDDLLLSLKPSGGDYVPIPGGDLHKDAVGHYYYDWTVPEEPGTWIFLLTGHEHDGDPLNNGSGGPIEDVYTVEDAPSVGFWTTIQEIEDENGVTVTEAELKRAQKAIDRESPFDFGDDTLLSGTKLGRRLRAVLAEAVTGYALFLHGRATSVVRQQIAEAKDEGLSGFGQGTRSANWGTAGGNLSLYAHLGPRAARALDLLDSMLPVSYDAKQVATFEQGLVMGGAEAYAFDRYLWRQGLR